MSDEPSPRLAEAVPVTLARMEGVLNNISEKVNSHAQRLDKAESGIIQLTLTTQRLADAADADRATAKALAEALEKDAEARRDQSTDKWTPFQRAITALSGMTAVAAVVIAVLK